MASNTFDLCDSGIQCIPTCPTLVDEWSFPQRILTRIQAVTQDDIKVVLEQFPGLSRYGFGYSDEVQVLPPEKRQAKFKENQEKLLNAAERCTQICEWLNQVGKAKPIHFECWSYGLKHVVEKAIGKYCSNGEFICAAIHMGFKCRRDGPNAYFNMSVPDLKRLKKDAEVKQMARLRAPLAVLSDR